MILRILCLTFLFSLLAPVQADELKDLPFRQNWSHVDYVVNEDGTATEMRESAVTVLKESAVDWLKRANVTHSTSAQKAEILKAYTQKPDGRRIEVSKDSYQIETNSGRDKGAPAYSDWTTVGIVFPDVAVGDTLVLSYRLTQTDPLFPGNFSTTGSYPRQMASDDVRVSIDYPASLWVQYESHGMQQREQTAANGRKIVEWRFQNPNPAKNMRRDYSVIDLDKETGYAFSTFHTHAEIAAAYGRRATPKAAVTERVRALAAEIVKDRTAPKDQAHALYDWVATHITYAGNCIGIGAVVPRDLDFVLDHKMGDCKDHATLLQALLAARGIASTQALVNAGAIYRLPRVPVVSMVNHVINYVPSLNLYLDATSKSIPFGMLPFADSDKAVLLVEGHVAGTKTPPAGPAANQQKLVSKLKLAANGTITGTVEVSQKGYNAAAMRATAREMTKDSEEDFIKNMYRSIGMVGFGKLEKDDPTALADTYRYKGSLTLEKFANTTSAGAFYIYPLLTNSLSINDIIGSSLTAEEDADTACSGGRSSEEYVIELPKGMKVLSLPPDLKLANAFVSYSASYRLKGNLLTVKRSLDDRTVGNVCSPAVAAEYKAFAEKVADNLKAQVLYK